MTESELRQRIEAFVSELTAEELEERIAPVDCAKKPEHPECRPRTWYGGPTPDYGGPAPEPSPGE